MNKPGNKITILFQIILLCGCLNSQESIIVPGKSIGEINLGYVIEQGKEKEFRAKLKQRNISITLEKGMVITAIITKNENHRLDSGIQIGSSVEDLITVMGKPLAIDGEALSNYSLDLLDNCFIAYAGISFGIENRKIDVIIIFPEINE